jgi:hypothetical protein
MLDVKKIQGTSRTVVSLDGVVDESFNLSELTDLQKNSDFFCMGVRRINSTGIKKWINYFNGLREKKYAFTFHQLSPGLVEQFNLISNFGCGGTVVSVTLPYTCKSCGTANPVIKEKSEVVGIDLEKVDWPCASCGQTALEFDDLADEYLNFWK